MSVQVWAGMETNAWLGMLARNGWDIDRDKVLFALTNSLLTLGSTVLNRLQDLLYGGAIRRTAFPHPPVFVLGHWRSGTTLLFNLLSQDAQFCFPNALQCFTPGHFLLTQRLLVKLDPLYRGVRATDNFPIGLTLPSVEDEFALNMLGLPSPYQTYAFPNRGGAFMEYLDFEGVPSQARERWKRKLLTFMKALTLQSPPLRLYPEGSEPRLPLHP